MKHRKLDESKHLLNFISNIITLIVEGALFAYMWYAEYSTTISMPFFRRGNWAVIGLYVLIIFFFTKVLNGYKVGYLRFMDICLSHVLAILFSGGVGYMIICMVARDYVSLSPIMRVVGMELLFVVPWVFIVRKIYGFMYPPRKMLLIYGEYSPDEMVRKINNRNDKFNICGVASYTDGNKKLRAKMNGYEAVVLCDLPASVRNELMKYCYQNSIRVYVTPKISDILLTEAEDINLFDTPLLLCRNRGLSVGQRLVKRCFDFVLAVFATIIASPIMLLIAIAIKLYDRGPVFYRQDRLTQDGREFQIWKFRSMRVDSEKDGARLASKQDDRITPVGRIIRRTHFDEIPQLLNILCGDMSFVGPRPERREIHDQYCQSIPEFDFRLKVKAGLTGYAQVFGKYNTTPYDKLKFDLTYIERYSLWLDIKLMLLTVKVIFQKENTEGVDEGQITAEHYE